MKKILLAAVALLTSAAGMAQTEIVKINPQVKKQAVSLKNIRGVKLSPDMKLAPATRAAAKAMPEGEQREFFRYSYDYIYSISDDTQMLFMRADKDTLVYGSDGTVYIPNSMYTSMLPQVYLEGTLSADGTTLSVPAGQSLGTIEGYDMYLYKVQFTDNGQANLIETPIEYTVDANYGVLQQVSEGEEGIYPALVGIQGQNAALLTYSDMYTYIPVTEQLFAQPVQRTLTCEYTNSSGQVSNVTATVEDYDAPVVNGRFIKGFFCDNPESWAIGIYDESGNLVFVPQIPADECVVVPGENTATGTNIDFGGQAAFTSGADGSYSYTGALFNVFYYAGDNVNAPGLYMNGAYENISLSAPTPAGIGGVEVSDNGEAVATEYYDLSGRRVNSADKGVNIVVKKYADGTKKAVKVIK